MSEKILDRVRALLAKAEDPAATPAEAEAFSAKAEELIAKYAVDIALLEARTDKGKPSKRTIKVPNPYAKPKVVLLNGIALAHSCKALWHSSQGYVTVVGYESDLEVVEMLFASLLLQATNASLKTYVPEWESTRSFRTSFWYGFASRASTRMEEMQKRAEREAAEASSPGTALVLRDRKDDVEQAFREYFPNTRRASGGRVGSGSGFGAGRTAADRADLGGQRLSGSRRAIG